MNKCPSLLRLPTLHTKIFQQYVILAVQRRLVIQHTNSFSDARIVTVREKLDEARFKVLTIPNTLSISRILSTPAIGFLVIHENFTAAFVLFLIAGFTDMADGFIARNVPGQKTLLGSVLDPVSDKLLISVMFVTMSMVSLVPTPLTVLVILRDALLISGGFYKRYKTLEPPISLKRFFNPEVSSMQIIPTRVSKLNTALQLAVVACSLAQPVFNLGDVYQDFLCILSVSTAITTVYSGLQYARGTAFRRV